MNNLKSRMKRRRGASHRATSHEDKSTTSVGADWEFLNFNPGIFQRPPPPFAPPSPLPTPQTPPPPLPLKRHDEDYYEFPTSTKLQSPPPPPPLVERRSKRKEGGGTEDSSSKLYQRHSVHSTFDLLTSHTPSPHLEESTPGKYAPLPSPPPLPTPAFVTSVFPSSCFYLPTPPERGAPPLRPKSWGSDSGRGTLKTELNENGGRRTPSRSGSRAAEDVIRGKRSTLTPNALLVAIGEQIMRGDFGEKGSGSGGGSGVKIGSVREEKMEGGAEGAPPTTTSDPQPLGVEEPRRGSTNVGRSESCKEQGTRQQRKRERRKHSDPSLKSKTRDVVDVEAQQLLLTDAPSGSSSNSSLSLRSGVGVAGRESPSPSVKEETGGRKRAESPESVKNWEDSDVDTEPEAPDWTKGVPNAVLSTLSSTQKKRQQVLNELVHTERSHVRNLKVLERLFHRPLRLNALLPPELTQMLFAHLGDMLDVHGHFNVVLKRLKADSPLIPNIGPLLLSIFEGERGGEMKRTASSYCAHQQIALRLLKQQREKNAKLQAFLSEVEGEAICRRLQLQDMIPMAMQRLTKYPLILENLLHATEGDEEKVAVGRALEAAKDILSAINVAKKRAEDAEHLADIQRRLDKSSLDKVPPEKMEGVGVGELRALDLTTHTLVHAGSLLWRVRKQKSEVLQEVELLLLEDMVVVLLKQDDRFVLKIHSNTWAGKTERSLTPPIIHLHNLIHRANASNKTAFMLINVTSTNMYEFLCPTGEERKQWLLHMTKASEDYKARTHPNIPTPPPPPPLPSQEEESKQEKEESGGEGGGEVEPEVPPPCTSPSISSSSDGEQSPPVGRGRGERRMGEFLLVTETSPLIQPTEVLVTSNDVHFAQPVLSHYEELKLLDDSIQEALHVKLQLVSNLLHLTPPSSEEAQEETPDTPPRDVKQLVVACMQKVDQLGRILSRQKLTNETIPAYKEQATIQQSLNNLLTQLLTEVHRKDEELELRRCELHRLREQNHGYQERLLGLTKGVGVGSPVSTRPNSYLEDSDAAPPLGSSPPFQFL